MKTDIVEVMEACIDGRTGRIKSVSSRITRRYAWVLASEGYPVKY